MMYKFCFGLVLATLVMFSCKNQASTTAPVKNAGDGKHFGQTITTKGAISYDAMLAKMGKTDSLAAKVTGKVSAVCKAKGCWMEIVSDKPGAPVMTVKFKDYGFFMPKDIAGRSVTMDGYAFTETTSVDELRHYAEDAGKSKEDIMKITQPKTELKFMAHGVVLLD
jgi:Domain of unknown function (DUF4920)